MATKTVLVLIVSIMLSGCSHQSACKPDPVSFSCLTRGIFGLHSPDYINHSKPKSVAAGFLRYIKLEKYDEAISLFYPADVKNTGYEELLAEVKKAPFKQHEPDVHVSIEKVEGYSGAVVSWGEDDKQLYLILHEDTWWIRHTVIHSVL